MTRTTDTSAAGGATATVVAAADACTALAIALDRLFNLATLYPADHVRCRDVANEFREAVEKVIKTGKSVTIGVTSDTLTIEGRPLDATTATIKRPWEILAKQGIATLEIDADASSVDIRELVTMLLKYRHEAESASEFRQFDYSSLPQSIRVRRRRFGQGGAWTDNHQEIEDAIQEVIETLRQWDLDEEQQAACRAVLDDLLDKAVDRLDGVDDQQVDVAIPDGANLGLRILNYVVNELVPQDHLRNAAQSRQGLAESAIALTDNRRSVELMINMLRGRTVESDPSDGNDSDLEASKPEGNAPAEEAAKPVATDRDIRYEVPKEQLLSWIDGLQSATDPVLTLAPADRSEELAVAMQCFLDDLSPTTTAWLNERLREALDRPLGDNESRLILEGIAEIASLDDSGEVDSSLPTVIRRLRRSKYESAGATLVKVFDRVAAPAKDQLWPHLVNEILIAYDRETPQVVEALGLCISVRPLAEEDDRFERILTLEAMRDGRLRRQAINARHPWLMPILARMLRTSREKRIGALVHKAFLARRGSWPGSQVLDLLPGYSTANREFFEMLLNDTGAKQISEALRSLAGRMLAKALPTLPKERRDEEWVEGAIRALGALRPPRAEPILRDILESRRLLVIHLWPSGARMAAREALSILKAGISAHGRRGSIT